MYHVLIVWYIFLLSLSILGLLTVYADGRDDELPPKEDVRSTESPVRVFGRVSRLTEGASSQGGLRTEDLARYYIEEVSLQKLNDNSSVALM